MDYTANIDISAGQFCFSESGIVGIRSLINLMESEESVWHGLLFSQYSIQKARDRPRFLDILGDVGTTDR